jgi:hypothetical protein
VGEEWPVHACAAGVLEPKTIEPTISPIITVITGASTSAQIPEFLFGVLGYLFGLFGRLSIGEGFGSWTSWLCRQVSVRLNQTKIAVVHFLVSTKDVAQIVWNTDVNFQLREACMLLLNFHEAGQTWADNKLGSIFPVLAVSEVISARPKKQSPCFASGRRVAMKDLQFVLKQTKSRCNAKEPQ